MEIENFKTRILNKTWYSRIHFVWVLFDFCSSLVRVIFGLDPNKTRIWGDYGAKISWTMDKDEVK